MRREELEKYLRDSFAANAPWNEIVYALVSAEGTAEQNPAANFLLAHLNQDAVPATALTARLFLGIQVQCTQCHDHPFTKDKQDRFWELNSFFQQTEAETGLAAAGHADAKSVSDQVGRIVKHQVAGGAARLYVIFFAQVKNAKLFVVSHGPAVSPLCTCQTILTDGPP